MEKKATPKKSTSKKTQTNRTQKAAPKKNNQVVKTTKKQTTQKRQVVKSVNNQKKQKTQLKSSLSRKNANTGYLLSLASLITWVIPIVGTIIGVTGIYCCYSGLKSRRGLAMLGLLINILFLGISLVNINVDLALMN